jgi:molybdate transport repressor ModE-like protein
MRQGSGMGTEPEYLKKLKPMYKFWLESEDGYVFGQGSFELLKGIQEKGSLSGSAKARGMSYRYAWGIIKEIEKRIGKPILETHKGGKSGGGAKLTLTGRELLEIYVKFTKAFDQICLNWTDEPS